MTTDISEITEKDYVKDFISKYKKIIRPELKKEKPMAVISVPINDCAIRFQHFQEKYSNINPHLYTQYRLAIGYLHGLGQEIKAGNAKPRLINDILNSVEIAIGKLELML